MGDPIRLALESDKPAIGAIVEATSMFPADMLDEMMAPFFSGSDTELWFVIGAPAVAIAYAVPERLTNGTWNQLLIAIDPSHQRNGLGRRLMRHLETNVAERQGRIVLVETSGVPEFESTRSFYRSIGYTEEARIRDFYDSGDDKIVFRKELAG